MHPDTEQPFTLDRMAGQQQPRRRTGRITGIAAGAVLLVGATVAVTMALTHGEPPAPAAQQSQAAQVAAPTTTAAADAPTATAAAPAAPQTPTVLKLAAKADGPRSMSTVYSYKQPVAANAPKPDQEGFEWAAADIEICSKVDSYMSRISWRLTYADHTTIEPSSVGYRQFPQPEYPWDERDISTGQCIRGWLTFAVPKGQKPATVQYQPEGFRADWSVA